MNFTRISSEAQSDIYCTERAFKKRVEMDVKKMTATLTLQEQMQVALVPIILSQIAWHFADKALALCASYRVDMLKKLARTIKMLRTVYDRAINRDLDPKHRGILERETGRFLDECQYDFTILYYAVNSEFKRDYPSYPYDDMRTDAILSLLIIRLLDSHNRKMDALIADKMGLEKPSVRMREIDSLYSAMEAFAGIDGSFRFNERNIALALKVIENRIKQIQFNIV